MKHIFSGLLPALLLLLISGNTTARTIVAGVGTSFPRIQEAIRAAQPGDTVLVKPATYREGNITIDKPLVLLGEGRPVLDGQKKYEVLSVRASDVVVSGFRVQRSGHSSLEDPGGIKVYNARNVEISGNVLHDNFFGVYLSYCTGCVVKHNTIVSSGKDEQAIGNGVHCWKSDSLQIIGNTIEGHRDGIYFEFVTHSVIWRNISRNNVRYGLHFMFSHNDAYFANVFRHNGAGVAVMFTKNVTMMANVFEDNWGDAAYGLLLKEISDSYLSGNRFLRNTSGIFMEGTSRCVVEKNLFSRNGWAMQIQASCMDNTVRNNNFSGNSFDVGTNGSLVLNTFSGNYWDRYEGYDLNKDGVGDVPFHPLSLFSVVIEQKPAAMLLYRSFMISLLDRSERIFPSITPENFVDNSPRMKALPL